MILWEYTIIFPYKIWNKVSIQISLERNSSNFSKISFLGMNFENLTVKFHVPHVLNLHIKFHPNQILFTILSINLFFIGNIKQQYSFSRSTINAYSFLSYEWWVPLIKFMVGLTIHVRGGSIHLWYSEST